MRSWKGQRGFTLVELLITTALLGLVVAGGFRLYFFAHRAFSAGSRRSDLVAEMDYALRYITEEVRLAHSLAIGATRDELSLAHHGQDGELDSYFLYSEEGSIFLETSHGVRTLLDGPALGTRYQLTFGKGLGTGGKQVNDLLSITLESQDSELGHTLHSDVQVLNLRQSGITGEAEGQAIVFTKTFSPEERGAAERLRPRCVYLTIYGPQAPEVRALRAFRDGVLAESPLGRVIVQAYYLISPAVISFLEQHQWVEAPVQRFFQGIAGLVLRSEGVSGPRTI